MKPVLIVSYALHSTGGVELSSNITTFPTSLIISWSLVGGVTANGDYTISYSNINTHCFTRTNTSTAARTATETILTGLQEGTQYSITVTVTLSNGGTGSDNTTATTMAAG